jgi:hypothetical protein
MALHDERDERIEISIDAAQGGRWIVPPVSYIDPVRRFCTMTGRPIARGYWQVMNGGREVVFSDRAHAERYATYPIRSETSSPRDPDVD